MSTHTAPSARRIHELLQPWVATQPDHLAVQDGHCQLTYQQLWQASVALAQLLQTAGVRPGDRVLIVGENCVAACALFLACSHFDAWACVVNARLSGREISQFIAHSGARRVVYLSYVSGDAAAHAQQASAQAWATPVGTLALGPLQAHAVPEPCHAAAAEQVAALVYTSGTTGQPKGVMLTHGNLLFAAHNTRTQRGLTPADVVYGVLPMAHVVGLAVQFLGTISAGSTLLLEPRFTPQAAARALREQGVSLMSGVPALFARLLAWYQAEGMAVQAPRLRVISVGAAPLTATLKAQIEQAMGLPLYNGYGLTETATLVQTTGEGRSDCAVGHPLPGVQVQLRDRQGHTVAQGEVGELWVRSPGRMLGYYRNPEATAQVLDSGGWFNTGDLASQGPDGALHIAGRSKELIIRSGFNVYPIEVEQVINSFAGVLQSAVVGREVPDNEEVVAFVETKAGHHVDVAQLMAYLREHLSPYKLPAEIRVVPAMPAAPTGKILKHLLKDAARQPQAAEGVA